MTDYDPFARGPHPVGVRAFEVTDQMLPGIPPSPQDAVRDADPAGKIPEAATLLERPLDEVLAERGINVQIVDAGSAA